MWYGQGCPLFIPAHAKTAHSGFLQKTLGKTISAESSVMSLRRSNWSRNWTELSRAFVSKRASGELTTTEDSALSCKPRLFPHKLSIWSPCGAVLSGGMYDVLTTMWHCVVWWNARQSDHHVALCWLIECTIVGSLMTQHSNDCICSLPDWIASYISHHQWMCTIMSFEGCV